MNYKKKTNNFETSIFGIDLFVIWIINQIKKRKESKNHENQKRLSN